MPTSLWGPRVSMLASWSAMVCSALCLVGMPGYAHFLWSGKTFSVLRVDMGLRLCALLPGFGMSMLISVMLPLE